MEIYCLKCKEKKSIDNAEEVTMKNGKPGFKAVCPDCGTKMFRIGGKKD